VRAALPIAAAFLIFTNFSRAQDSGVVAGTVKDPSGAVIPAASLELVNVATEARKSIQAGATGDFRFEGLAPGKYTLTVSSPGFTTSQQSVDVTNAAAGAAPLELTVTLTMAEAKQTVLVEAAATEVENQPTAHVETNSLNFSKLPQLDAGSGLSSVINLTTGGTAADANGFFHPLGDHAQVSFIIDGQPISDQQSKVFSTQIPADAIQGLELISGSPEAQYGDKTSLVVNANTKSGLGARQPYGSVRAYWGSFGTWGENATLGAGTEKFGNFISLDAVRTGHFLDTPEFLPIHDIGNNGSIFDRIDFQPNVNNIFRLNLFAARNWFQAPNSYDQLSQDQKQRVLTWNIAPAYERILSVSTILTVNLFSRRDQVNYYGSRDPLLDQPATESQNRFLTNWGGKADLSTIRGRHSLKLGVQLQQTRLLENFSMAITDPNFDFSRAPGLLPYDLVHGGSFFNFHGTGNINVYAVYAADTITAGQFTLTPGLRIDRYDGLTSDTGISPRLGISYLVKPTGTVLRVAYSRTFETPFNENLLLSSATGQGGLAQNIFGAVGSRPIDPGFRNQFNGGLQQKINRWLTFDGDYFWKYTHNAYDFDVLFNTPITFPVSWNNSKVDGFTGRLSTTTIHGFQAYLTLGHTRARYFPPEVGGLIFQGLASTPGVFRIDHDQAMQATTNLRYQMKNSGPWLDFIWRFDSGLVVTGVPDSTAALTLTPAQQVAIGLSCDGMMATYTTPLRTCAGPVTSALLTLPAAGTENNDHNPDRVKPRNLFDIAAGTDNLLRSDTRRKVTLRMTVTNLTNKVALYNFLSTFSGTHFVPPRTYEASVGYVF
jgi:hypothetical protein